jgi:transcriptional regulator with XRE-family HTH domain
MSDDTIGRALRTRRAVLGLDQREAATRIGMSRTTYSSYERDTQRPSVDVLPAIAEFLEISIDDVLVLFGASAIAAARTALSRLHSGVNASAGSTSSTSAPSSDTASSDEVANDYSANGVSHDNEAAEPRPSSSHQGAESIESTNKTPSRSSDEKEKAHDEKEKGKKKKKKKDKREKLVNPAFATHV